MTEQEKQEFLQKLYNESAERVAQKLREQIGVTVIISKEKPKSENFSFVP